LHQLPPQHPDIIAPGVLLASAQKPQGNLTQHLVSSKAAFLDFNNSSIPSNMIVSGANSRQNLSNKGIPENSQASKSIFVAGIHQKIPAQGNRPLS
jgi:hypothetical protein